jgi:hypothetical protein
MSSIDDRIRLFMNAVPDQARKFKQLEEWTGIPSDRWSAVSLGRQRPTTAMVEALCKEFQSLAMWITTGRSRIGSPVQVPLDTYLNMKAVDRKMLRLKTKREETLTAAESEAAVVNGIEELLTDSGFDLEVMPDFSLLKNGNQEK